MFCCYNTENSIFFRNLVATDSTIAYNNNPAVVEGLFSRRVYKPGLSKVRNCFENRYKWTVDYNISTPMTSLKKALLMGTYCCDVPGKLKSPEQIVDEINKVIRLYLNK